MRTECHKLIPVFYYALALLDVLQLNIDKTNTAQDISKLTLYHQNIIKTAQIYIFPECGADKHEFALLVNTE